jgi:hypothetical protein
MSALPKPCPTLLLRLLAGLALCLSAAVAPAARADEAPPDPADRVSERQAIEKLLTDQTFYGRYNPDGKAWSEYQAPDGRTAYREENCIYAGHWWIQGDLVCYRYDAFNAGRPACFAVFRRGPQLGFYMPGADGQWLLNAYTLDRKPGNPDQMPVEGQACVGV